MTDDPGWVGGRRKASRCRHGGFGDSSKSGMSSCCHGDTQCMSSSAGVMKGGGAVIQHLNVLHLTTLQYNCQTKSTHLQLKDNKLNFLGKFFSNESMMV